MFDLFRAASDEFPSDGTEDTTVTFSEVLEKINSLEDGPEKLRAIAKFIDTAADTFSSEQIDFILNSQIQIKESKEVTELQAVLNRNYKAISVLRGLNINTLQDISENCPKDILERVHGVGVNSIKLISEALRARGLKFAETKPMEREDRVFVLYAIKTTDAERVPFKFLSKTGYKSIFELSNITESMFRKRVDSYREEFRLSYETEMEIRKKSYVTEEVYKEPENFTESVSLFFGLRQPIDVRKLDFYKFEMLKKEQKTWIMENLKYQIDELMSRLGVHFKEEEEA